MKQVISVSTTFLPNHEVHMRCLTQAKWSIFLLGALVSHYKRTVKFETYRKRTLITNGQSDLTNFGKFQSELHFRGRTGVVNNEICADVYTNTLAYESTSTKLTDTSNASARHKPLSDIKKLILLVYFWSASKWNVKTLAATLNLQFLLCSLYRCAKLSNE